MVQRSARSAAPPEAAWALLARPGRWHEWAPHVRGAWGLGKPEVRSGARGVVRLLGALPVPATITEKVDGRSWSWRVGPVDMVHQVRPRADGCEVVIQMHAAAPLEALLARAYAPLVGALLGRLAALAERG